MTLVELYVDAGDLSLPPIVIFLGRIQGAPRIGSYKSIVEHFCNFFSGLTIWPRTSL